MISPKTIITLSALAMLFVVSAFGPSMSMPMDTQGRMSNCPFSLGTASMCPMNFAQHIGYWQQLFASTIPVNGALAFLILFVILSFGIFWQSLINDTSQKSLPTRLHKEWNARLKLFNPLILLFSDGILNSKVYAFSN